MPESSYSDLDDLICLMNELDIASAHLIGVSSGGKLVIDFALKHSDRVTSMVLVGAVVSGYGYTSHFYTRGGRMTTADRGDPDRLKLYICLEDPYEVAPENVQIKERIKFLLDQNPQNLNPRKSHYRLQPERPAMSSLDQINAPAFIIVGEYDIPDCHAHSGVIDAGITFAQRVIIQDAGHLVPLEQPEAFNNVVLKFLQDAPFLSALASQGVAEAVDYHRRNKSDRTGEGLFSEDRMNRLAYRLLQRRMLQEALLLFQLNIEEYPESWNTYDSYAEALMIKGDYMGAVKNYRKSLELNPDNNNAVEMLKRLEEN